jgi:recombination protein RecT
MAAYLHGTALSPRKFEQVALAQLRDPKIVQCDPKSVMLSVVGAAQLGLQIGVAGQAYIVPFKGQAQLIVGYQGYINLMHKAGFVTFAEVVYEGDEFDYHVDADGQHLIHRPKASSAARIDDNLTHAYAVATTPVNGVKMTTIKVLDRAELLKIRDSSRATRDDSPWRKWFAEMCKKSAVRRLAKQCAKSTDVARAVEFEDRAERGEPIDDLLDEPMDVTGNDRPAAISKLDNSDIPGTPEYQP